MSQTDDAVEWEGRHVFVSGRVQGVGFRWAAMEEAQRRGLGGWVRNRRDGRVELVICGTHDAVLGMLAWLRRGPPAASVAGLEVEDSTERVFDFEMLGTI